MKACQMLYVPEKNMVMFDKSNRMYGVNYFLSNKNQPPSKYDVERSIIADKQKWLFYIPPKNLRKYTVIGLSENNTIDIHTMPQHICELKLLRLKCRYVSVPKKVLILYIDSPMRTTVQFKCSKNIRAITLSMKTNIPIQLSKRLVYLNFESQYKITGDRLHYLKSEFSQKLDLPKKLLYLELSDLIKGNIILPDSLSVLIFNSSNRHVMDNIPCGLSTLIRDKYYAEPLINLPNTLKMYKICEKKYEIKWLDSGYGSHFLMPHIWC